MRSVAALVVDPVAIRDIRAAVGSAARAYFVDDDGALRELAERNSLDAVVVEIGSGRAREIGPAMTALRHGFPSLPIIAYARIGADLSREVADAFRAGADRLVLRGVDDLALAMRQALERPRDVHYGRLALARLGADLPPHIAPVVTYCLEHINEPFTVEALARASGVHRKTLVNRFARAGWPPPSVTAAWCRVLVATLALETPGRTLAQTAPLVGCPSAPALRAMVRRLTGRSPRVLRELGFDGVLALLRSTIREHPEGGDSGEARSHADRGT